MSSLCQSFSIIFVPSVDIPILFRLTGPMASSRYDELFNRLHRGSNLNSYEAQQVLKRLYRTNLILARLALITDYVRVAKGDFLARTSIEDHRIIHPYLSPSIENYRDIQPHLSQYCKLIIYISL